jgi:peptide/nickel transport system substrate-binding protein
MVFLNHKSETIPYFQDKKVRQAMLAGINRPLMIDTLMQGQALVATSPILPGTWAYNNALTPIAFDPLRADQLLTEAGWAKPTQGTPGAPDFVRTKTKKPFTFTLLSPNDAAHIAVAKWVVGSWAQIGIQAKVDLKPIAEVYAALNARQFDAALVDITFANLPDPDPYPFWHQTQIESGQNFSGFDSRNMSEILEQARVTPSYIDRAKFYRAFQSQFVDQTPALLLYYPVFNYAVDKKVRGVQIGPLVDRSDRFSNISEWYIVTRRVISNASQP